MKGFDPTKKIPTVVWLSKDGKLYMISGHHLEAACQRRNLNLRRQIEEAIEALALAKEKDGVNSFSNVDLRNTFKTLLKEFEKTGRWLLGIITDSERQGCLFKGQRSADLDGSRLTSFPEANHPKSLIWINHFTAVGGAVHSFVSLETEVIL
jgi:hypothetical protein